MLLLLKTSREEVKTHATATINSKGVFTAILKTFFFFFFCQEEQAFLLELGIKRPRGTLWSQTNCIVKILILRSTPKSVLRY